MAGRLLDEDPEAAYAHAVAARDRAGRIGAVREAAGIAAYLTGRYAEALAELRAARRISGDQGMLPVMADCERGLGRPEKALAMASSPEVRQLDAAGRAEMLIVASGARRDLGQPEAAALLLPGTRARAGRRKAWSARLLLRLRRGDGGLRAHRRGRRRGSATRPTPTRPARPTPTNGWPSCRESVRGAARRGRRRPTRPTHRRTERWTAVVPRSAGGVRLSTEARSAAGWHCRSDILGERAPRPAPTEEAPWPSAPPPPQHRPGTSTRCTSSVGSPVSLAGASCRAVTCWCPSGVVVSRAPARRGARSGGPTVDTLDCAAWRADVQRSVERAAEGDLVELHGSLRRRFWRVGPEPPAAARWRWCG